MPAATRFQGPGWRDPRLWVGVALVAGSVVAGAQLVGGADDTVGVWAAARDLSAGETVRADDLVATRVRFAEAGAAAHYLQVEEPLPVDLRLTRPLDTGELVPSGALGADADSGTLAVSLSLPPEQVPATVAAGVAVDVWVLDEARQGRMDAEEVLDDVVVLDVPAVAESFGSVGGGRQVVIAVPETETEALGRILAASGDDRVRVVARG